MLCFAVDQENSDDECVKKWIDELRGFSDKVPIVLVLMKNDLLKTEEFENDRTKIKFNEDRLNTIKADCKLQNVFSTSSTD